MILPLPEDLPAVAGAFSRNGLVTEVRFTARGREAREKCASAPQILGAVADTGSVDKAKIGLGQAMMSDEKQQLLALLEHRGKWCRDAEARDATGNAVTYDDDTAVAWDLTGALYRLFGWQRACVLFGQVERHLIGKRPTVGWPPRDTSIEAMIALQEFNDQVDTTFDLLRERLEALPVWSSGSRASGPAAEA